MCSEILTGENPFGDLPRIEMKKLVKAGEGPLRPNLPLECPERLASLIRRCWDANFRNRPYFDESCRKLRYIKALLLRGELRTSNVASMNIMITDFYDLFMTYCNDPFHFDILRPGLVGIVVLR